MGYGNLESFEWVAWKVYFVGWVLSWKKYFVEFGVLGFGWGSFGSVSGCHWFFGGRFASFVVDGNIALMQLLHSGNVVIVWRWVLKKMTTFMAEFVIDVTCLLLRCGCALQGSDGILGWFLIRPQAPKQTLNQLSLLRKTIHLNMKSNKYTATKKHQQTVT